MTDITKQMVKCAKCGKESEQLIVLSVNYSLGDKESADKLLSRKQKCPYCGYEAINIDSEEKGEKMNSEKITKEMISNEYDYSNILPTVEGISYLAKYCSQLYEDLEKLFEEDEEKNKPLKTEFKNYKFKRKYSAYFQVHVVDSLHKSSFYKNNSEFFSAVNNGLIKNIISIEISLDLDFARGTGNNLDEHENSFKILFKPYDIKFIRKSNHNDPSMTEVENNIKGILDKFQTANTIFCSK